MPFAQRRFRPFRPHGFTLVEILLVIGVIAVLAIAVFMVYATVSQKSRATKAKAQIDMMAIGSMQIWNQRSPAITAAQGAPHSPSWYLKRANAFTEDNGDAADPRPITPWGDEVNILALGSPRMPYFMYPLPKGASSVCLDIMQHIKSSGLYSYGLMSSNGGTVLIKQEPEAYITAPSVSNEPTMDHMITVCANLSSAPLIRFVPSSN